MFHHVLAHLPVVRHQRRLEDEPDVLLADAVGGHLATARLQTGVRVRREAHVRAVVRRRLRVDACAITIMYVGMYLLYLPTSRSRDECWRGSVDRAEDLKFMIFGNSYIGKAFRSTLVSSRVPRDIIISVNDNSYSNNVRK